MKKRPFALTSVILCSAIIAGAMSACGKESEDSESLPKLNESESSNLLNNEYELKIKNVENKKEQTYLIKNAVKNIYCNKNIIAVNMGNTIEFVNTSGWLIKRFTSIQNKLEIISL